MSDDWKGFFDGVAILARDPARASVFASIGSASVVRFVFAPFSRLSTLLSVSRLRHSPEIPSSLFAGLRHLRKQHGLRSFWKGSFLSVAKHASALGSVHSYREWKKKISGQSFTIWHDLSSGFMAGLVSATGFWEKARNLFLSHPAIVSYPIDVLKTRATASLTYWPSILQLIREVSQEKALVRGYFVQAFELVPSLAISNVVYDHMQRQLKAKTDLSVMVRFFHF